MYQSSFLSATTIMFPSADPFSSSTLATNSIPSRAVLARGRTKSTIAASANPFFTSGSAFKILSCGVADTVEVMETPASLKPCAPKFPLEPSPCAAS